MKKTSILTATAIAILLSVSTWADTGTDEKNQAEKPMMNEGNNSSMMESHSTDKKTTTQDRQGQHRRHHQMPTMGGEGHGMMMDPHMMQMMMGHAQHQDMSAMAAGKGGMGMDPEMKQRREQHMAKMEQSMANIEALLAKLVEIQKP